MTPLGPARIKIKLAGDQIIGLAPENDDIRALAERTGLPLAARRHFGLEV